MDTVDSKGDSGGNSSKIFGFNTVLFERYPRIGNMEKHEGKKPV